MDDPEVVFRGELGPGEQLLWAGRARPGVLLRAADGFLIPFALLWCVMLAWGLVATIAQGEPGAWFAVVLLTAFLVPGLYWLGGRFILDAWRRSRTVYGVTSERVVIVSETFRRAVRTLHLDTLTDIILTERRDGSGDITFGPLPPAYGWHAGQGWTGAAWEGIPRLELADEVRPVYEIILGARRALKRTP
jgi:hypothetical protein